MTESDGIVVRLDGEYAWVQAAGPGPACGSCAQKGGCSTSGMGSILDDASGKARKTQLLCLPNTIHARPGDEVVIRVADGIVLKAVWRAYGIPLVFALAGAMLAVFLTGSDLVAIAGMLLGLVAGFLLLRVSGLDSSRSEPILSIAFKQSSVISAKGHETC
ncbi:MAG: SoxR reducing system RseC family protein [Rhodocyclaceae bacterium]|nr:SoxR reducing system RseC family protein [Rhodocyclaceae bacterium]